MKNIKAPSPKKASIAKTIKTKGVPKFKMPKAPKC
jgi:hypothetical protein